jgi:hypothetical protein
MTDGYGCKPRYIHCRVKQTIPRMVSPMRPVSKGISWLCLLLTLWSTYSFAVHHHVTSADEAQCTVCVVAHSASPAAASRLPNPVLVLLQVIVLGEPIPVKQRLIAFALSVRPPPVV